MKQSTPLRKPHADQGEAMIASERSRQSIDEWLAAAVTEQTRRAEARRGGGSAETPSAPQASPSPEPKAAITPELPHPVVAEPKIAEPKIAAPALAPPSAAERTVLDTAAKTAAALGSVASWIERAQEQLAETARASQAAEQRTNAVVTDAIGAIDERLNQIERRVESTVTRDAVEASRSPDGTGAVRYGTDDDTIKGLETRIREIADRLDAPRVIGRRGLSQSEEVEAAVAEIRSRQNALDEATPPVAEARHADERAPRAVATLDDRAFDGLREEMMRLQGSMEALARRDDVEAVERSVAALSERIGDDGGRSVSAAATAEGIDRISREMDVLTHKLDIVSAGSVDPAAVATMARDLAELRTSLGSASIGTDLGGFATALSDLKAEIGHIGNRQAESGDVAALRAVVEELRDGLTGPDGTWGLDPEVTRAAVQQATRNEVVPIATMLSDLTAKVDRIDRIGADTGAFESIERRIADLSAQIVDRGTRDPAIAALGHALADLMGEVSSWRTGMVDMAERAARAAVQETLNAWKPGSYEIQPTHETALVPEDDRGGLDEVNARLEDVVRRIGGLESQPVRHDDRVDGFYASRIAPTPPPAPVIQDKAERDAEETLRRITDALDAPTAPRPATAPDAEILLEPGAERPRAPEAAPNPVPAENAETRDVKASFIAAARRAAQAAAADAGNQKGKAARPEMPLVADKKAPGTGRLQSVLGRFRRPLLVSAAAIVVAVGGYRLIQDGTETRTASSGRGGQKVAETAAPPVVTAQPAPDPAPTVVARLDQPEPQTTQSAAPPRDVTPTPVPVQPERIAETPAVESRIPTPPAPLPPSPQIANNAAIPAGGTPIAAAPPSKPETAALPPSDAAARSAPAAAPGAGAPATGLRQAALNGEPAAMYEMASRTMDGRGVQRDPKAAAQLFEKAAEKNYAPAQYRIGNAYEKGIGVGRDIEAARRWYQRAAENGNTRAMHNLAVLMAEGAGGRPDYAAAIGWFQRAAEQGVRDSQFNLAVLFARGLGTSQDLVKSYTWFAIAAAQGDEEAGRKRDEVGSRLSPADLARAKTTAERWRMSPSSPAANEVQLPARWSDVGAAADKG